MDRDQYKEDHPLRIIIAGGGTGGHIFPAISIANALKKEDPSIEILFVGAKGRMEMEKIPQAGYKIEGLDISGFNRSSLIKNFGLPLKLLKSHLQVKSIFKRFRPGAVIGVGGYSSFPVLKVAQGKGIPSFIHESNSYGGKANRMLSKKAVHVFTGTDGMEKFFPPSKIMVTGNPVRAGIAAGNISKEEALRSFSLDANKKTILVVGGSLGARSVNEAIDKGLDQLLQAGLQLIWQTGKPYAAQAKQRAEGRQGVWTNEFITQMENAYAAADIVISRSGAMSVAELCVVKKPVLFVPYPFAAEDHQTVNAMKLVEKKAAMIIKDSEASTKLVPMVIDLAKNETLQNEMKKNISPLGITNADEVIAGEILSWLKHKK
jgi:UDP-N-acetylglucosamine--N-acetylmuramyl-(pentapeptide) pyrophosphoryl-undecaprenol N-acetylglucosamine transferase